MTDSDDKNNGAPWYDINGIPRYLVGRSLTYLSNAMGAAAATGVLLGDGESVPGKVVDGVTAVPNFVQNFQNYWQAWTHRDELIGAAEYIRDNAPSQEIIDAKLTASKETLEQVAQAGEHLQSAWGSYDDAKQSFLDAKNKFFDLTADMSSVMSDYLDRAWEVGPIDAYNTTKSEIGRLGTEAYRLNDLVESGLTHANTGYQEAQAGMKVLPDGKAIENVSTAANELTGIVESVQRLNIDPIYHATMNAMDNCASDEIASTIAVAGSFIAAGYIGSKVFGTFWQRRGRPNLLSRLIERAGVYWYEDWYRRNAKDIVDSRLYEIIKEDVLKDLESKE